MTEWLTVILLLVLALKVWSIDMGHMSTMPENLRHIKNSINDLHIFIEYKKSKNELHRDQHQADKHKQVLYTLSSIERLVGELKTPNNTYLNSNMRGILQVLHDIEKSVNRLR